jgi:hypothetical protein
MAVDVCYVLKDGFPARMILHSRILHELRSHGVTVAIVVPHSDEEVVQAVAEELGVQVFEAPDMDSKHLTEYEWLIRRYLFEDVLKNPSLRSWHLKLKDSQTNPLRHRIRSWVYLAINRMSLGSKWVRRRLADLERRVFLENEAVQSVVDEVAPKLLVSTYPVSILESCFLHAASKSGVHTVSQLLSWDNITSKGQFSVISDDYVSWGPIMTEELQEYYGIPRSRIFECGVAHFDEHVNGVVAGAVGQILSEIGLNPDHPYLFFGMSSPTVSPNEIEVVEWLANAVRDGAFGSDMQLIVRPHPQNLQGYTADQSWLPRLKALAGGPVAIDYPVMEKSELAWNMKADDLPRLVNLLSGCSICLNSGSTLAIDGIIHDKPVVLSLFDGNAEIPWHRSIKRYNDVIHMRKLIELGGLRVASSYDDLLIQIRAYLADPSQDAEGRENTRRQECGDVDGHACERIAEALAGLVGKSFESASEETVAPDE